MVYPIMEGRGYGDTWSRGTYGISPHSICRHYYGSMLVMEITPDACRNITATIPDGLRDWGSGILAPEVQI